MKVLLTTLVALAILVVVFGKVFDWWPVVGEQAIKDVNQKGADLVRVRTLIGEREKEINKGQQDLGRKRVELARASQNLPAMEEKRDNFQSELTGHEEALKVATQWLGSNADPNAVLQVGPQGYNRAEVQQDRERRTARCEELRIRLSGLIRNCEGLKNAIDQGRTTFKEKEIALDDERDKLKHIEIRLQTGQAIKETDKIIASLNARIPGVGNDKVLSEIEKRLSEYEDSIERHRSTSGRNDFINYSEASLNKVKTQSRADRYVQKYLTPATKPAGTPAPAKSETPTSTSAPALIPLAR